MVITNSKDETIPSLFAFILYSLDIPYDESARDYGAFGVLDDMDRDMLSKACKVSILRACKCDNYFKTALLDTVGMTFTYVDVAAYMTTEFTEEYVLALESVRDDILNHENDTYNTLLDTYST
tara:strand:- start:17424 stop:17792 length:369 start_codon:yes stop_codon:yes gene_type:complete